MIGVQLGGFIVERELGRGAMGTVYQARQVSLDRPVAVKVLHAHLSDDATFIERFRREARGIAKLNHPNIVRILGIGEHERAHYFAMELVNDRTIKERLERDGRFSPRSALRVMAQACQGVHAAHEAGVVHRDLKPENLALDSNGRVKVMDFGVARQQDADEVGLTSSGTLVGTPAFMSPEQAAGRQATPASDVYSLGVVFYELLTGALPFDHPDLLVLLQQHQWDEPAAPRTLVPEIPVGIEEIVLQMLAKAPAERYATCAEVVADLRAVAKGHGERSSARGTRTTGAVGRGFRPPADTAPPVDDPLAALTDLAYTRLLESARQRRVILCCRNGGELCGSAGHFEGDKALLTVAEVGEIALPLAVLDPEPYGFGLDDTVLRAESDQWARAYYAQWVAHHGPAAGPDSIPTLLAEAATALPAPAVAPPLPEVRALAEGWAAVRAERQDLAVLRRGGRRTEAGTMMVETHQTYPDRLIMRMGPAVQCRIEVEKPSSLWVERADGRRVRIPVAEVQCILRAVPPPDAPRPAADAFADLIRLGSGRVIPCTILEQQRDSLRVRKADGHETRLRFTEIQSAAWAREDTAVPDAAQDADIHAAEQRVAAAEAAYDAAVEAVLAALARTRPRDPVQ